MSQETVDLLNNAFNSDRNAIHALMTNKVPCNRELADDPYIVVSSVPVLDGSFKEVSEDSLCQVGCLGLINGILAANNLPLVAMKFEESEVSCRSKMVGFCKYEAPSDPIH